MAQSSNPDQAMNELQNKAKPALPPDPNQSLKENEQKAKPVGLTSLISDLIAPTIPTLPIFKSAYEDLREAFGYHSPYDNLAPLGASLLNDAGESEGAQLRSQISDLQNQLADALKQARTEKSDRHKLAEELEKAKKLATEIQQKRDLEFLLNKTSRWAHKKLFEDDNFRSNFTRAEQCPTYVISMDLRRSTELMLKARSPQHFARFMTTLCTTLTEVIKEKFGVVDKFTGDGVLAFFPEFFSGPDAGYYAIATAEMAHDIFDKVYREHRNSFTTVLTDVGMGIGLDYGEVHLVQVAGGLTVVGPAVVYACRMGSAPAGRTYLNQPAYEKISGSFGNSCFINETKLEVKHEGGTLAYELRLSKDKPFTPRRPEWLETP